MTALSPHGALLALNDVSLNLASRAGSVNVLRGVSLELRHGESLAVTGPSGSGKTSLLMIMAGIERASAGRVVACDQDLTRLGEDRLALWRRANVGIVFQAFHLIGSMTALENVMVPLELLGRRDAHLMARQGLDQIGLSHRRDHYPSQLSGGEQQRVALARAFAADPPLILADEPTGNLDQATGAQVMDLLFDHQARTGATLVLVTHDPALAARCQRMVTVSDGRLA